MKKGLLIKYKRLVKLVKGISPEQIEKKRSHEICIDQMKVRVHPLKEIA